MSLSYTTPIFSRHFPRLTPTAKHSSSSLRACASQLCKYLRYLGWLDGLVSFVRDLQWRSILAESSDIFGCPPSFQCLRQERDRARVQRRPCCFPRDHKAGLGSTHGSHVCHVENSRSSLYRSCPLYKSRRHSVDNGKRRKIL